MLIDSKGIEDVIVKDLSSENAYARSDALKCVKWFSSSRVKEQVLKIAKKKNHEKVEEVHLMQALASLVEDTAFAEMLRKGVPAYLDALDIRQSRPPISKNIYDQACIDASSNEETVRSAGVVMLSFGKEEETALFLQKILENCEPQSKIVTDVVWTLDRLGYYTDEILPCLERMMSSKDTQQIVFNYLLRYGGITAEAAIGSYLGGHKLEEVTNVEEQVARLLVSRRDGAKEAEDFLWRMLNKGDPKYASNHNLLALSEAGDSLATDLLFDKAIADKNFIESPVIAIEAISRRDPEYAFEAAIRLIEAYDSMGCEVILLSINSKKAISYLLQFLERDIDTLSRWRIYRHLRWYAPQEELRTALELVLNNSTSRKREVVCEILGWLPFGMLDNVLDECVNDNERLVEKAAIQALRKRQEQSDIIQFLSEISNVDGMARWSRFYALLNLFDPRTLANNSDPLCIWPIVKKLPFEFILEAEKILEQKVKKEKQKANSEDRSRRNR
ncbi:MAG: hypothetical protein COA93_10965 [Alphaproteobacteria bacterium]|nr:MAG: hypothetical protein COA93_10965 [Alphaproteobacteria bacterium]